ncbi:MAG: PDZ domain-containing protein [Kofleriaceae bacterium]
MRLVVGLLALTLSGSIALADEAKVSEPQPEPAPAAPITTKAKVGLRVVRILPESNQALVFDKNRGTHVLAEVGSTIAGFTVESIDEDEVTLVSNGKELVLSAPESPTSVKRSLREERAPAKKIEPADPYTDAPADPYAIEGDAPIDPYAEPKVREVSAPTPIVAGESGVRVTGANAPSDPYASDLDPAPHRGPTASIIDGGAPSVRHKADPSWMSPAPAPGAPVAAEIPADPYGETEAPAAPVITPTVLSRSELNVALADFGKLATLLRGSFTAQGARLDVVAEGSVFAKAGLRSGDVVTAVDNVPLRSIDDAADLYVRASATRAANIQVLRAGKPLTFRVLIH